MPYDVLLLKRAETELLQATDWIAQQSPESAERWFRNFLAALLPLEHNPERCGWAPENGRSRLDLRQLIFRPPSGRSFRAIFTIVGDQVRVLRIRGAGQDLVAGESLD
jgi:plasmid stabilization system protein ParE